MFDNTKIELSKITINIDHIFSFSSNECILFECVTDY